MKCEEFENRLNDLLDARRCPSTDNNLGAHALRCPGCAQLVAGWSVVQEAIDLNDAEMSDRQLPSAEFTQNVINRMRKQAELPASSWKTAQWISAIAVVAALVLIALIPALPTLLESAASPTTSIAGTGTEPANSIDKEANVITQVPNGQGSDTLQSPGGNSDEVPGYSSVALNMPLPALDSVTSIEPNKIPGVRPIRSSITVAVGLLRTAFPGSKEDEPTKPQAVLMRSTLTLS